MKRSIRILLVVVILRVAAAVVAAVVATVLFLNSGLGELESMPFTEYITLTNPFLLLPSPLLQVP